MPWEIFVCPRVIDRDKGGVLVNVAVAGTADAWNGVSVPMMGTVVGFAQALNIIRTKTMFIVLERDFRMLISTCIKKNTKSYNVDIT
jgi:hypothetical protein